MVDGFNIAGCRVDRGSWNQYGWSSGRQWKLELKLLVVGLTVVAGVLTAEAEMWSKETGFSCRLERARVKARTKNAEKPNSVVGW